TMREAHVVGIDEHVNRAKGVSHSVGTFEVVRETPDRVAEPVLVGMVREAAHLSPMDEPLGNRAANESRCAGQEDGAELVLQSHAQTQVPARNRYPFGMTTMPLSETVKRSASYARSRPILSPAGILTCLSMMHRCNSAPSPTVTS